MGSTFQVAIDNAPVVTPGSAGTNISWNLSGLHNNGIDTILFAHVYATPYASYFPNANICQIEYSAGSAFYGYFNSGPTALTDVGFVIPGFTVDFYNPLDEIVAVNATYGSSWVSSYRSIQYYPGVQTGFDSSETIAHMIDSAKVDGWGSLTTPATVYGNVLRVNTITTDVIDSFFFRSDTVPHRWYFEGTQAGGVKSQSFEWFAKNIGAPVVTLNLDTARKMVSGGDYIFKTITGIPAVNITPQAVVYPNPSSDYLNILLKSSATEGFIRIMDITGREVEAMPFNYGKVVLNTSTYSAGMYVYSITDISGNLLCEGKFSVVH